MQASSEKLLQCVCSILHLHGGSLRAGMVGDELRRRCPELWRKWKARSKSEKDAPGLVQLCAELGAPLGLVVQDATDTLGEPLLRYSGGPVALPEEASPAMPGGSDAATELGREEAEATAALQRKLLRCAHKYAGGSEVPILWLVVGCERELGRHVRLLPRIDSWPETPGSRQDHDVLQNPDARPVDNSAGAPAAPARKLRLAARLRVFADGPGQETLFTLTPAPCNNAEHTPDCCCRSTLALTEHGACEAAEIAAATAQVAAERASRAAKAATEGKQAAAEPTEPDVRRATQKGQGRRAWRRHGSNLPVDADTVTAHIASGQQTLDMRGAWILLLRAQGNRCKDALLMVLELEAAAEMHGLPRRALKELAPGVWMLTASASSASFAKHVAHELAAVRLVLALHGASAFADGHALLEALPSALNMPPEGAGSCAAPTWSLAVEVREKAVDASCLPFRRCYGADLALDVAAAMSEHAPHLRYSRWGKASGASAPHRAFVVVEAAGGSLLLCERVPPDESPGPSASPCPLGVDEDRVLAWHRMWGSRPFSFSAGLDAFVASATLSLAARVWRHHIGDGAGLRPRLLDACCGSGTLSAVADTSGLFASVMAVELDASFVSRVQSNFEHASARVRVVQHDATLPFPEEIRVHVPQVVVSNPPWGWRLKARPAGEASQVGQEDAATRIMLNLLKEFPGAVMALICPELPPADAVASAGFSVHSRCALGQSAVWILVPTSLLEKCSD